MEILTDRDSEIYRTQVLNSPEASIFKQWASPLNRLQREEGEIPAMDIWQTSTRCIDELKKAGSNKLDEVTFIYTTLIKDCETIKQGRHTTPRTRAEAEASAQLIMTVTATRSLNYIEPGHEQDPENENDGILKTIMDEIGDNAFNRYVNLFFAKKRNVYGEKIVIEPHNPLADTDDTDSPGLQKEARQKAILTKVLTNTQGLKKLLNKPDYDDLTQCFETICSDDALLSRFEMIKPNGNSWGINRKMALNIIALFIKLRKLNIPMNQINTTIGGGNNNTYLTHHRPYNDNRTAFGITTEDYDAIVGIIEGCEG